MPQGSNDPNRWRPDAVANGATPSAGSDRRVCHRPFLIRGPSVSLGKEAGMKDKKERPSTSWGESTGGRIRHHLQASGSVPRNVVLLSPAFPHHHGEPEATNALRVRIRREPGWNIRLPEHLEAASLKHAH